MLRNGPWQPFEARLVRVFDFPPVGRVGEIGPSD
jgi:hypothetical protein